ncbi:retinitis pigmentosa GTPase regulator-like protein, putative [Trichomonas vaginalis G3]|uniref:Retinitis pigmentosa GTPase regulator-like protein, putative n=1 Tax=Trichomonas vaginalis (strain ATCC PRA-98 / G3) TaxID=412133 RepID=A2G6U2_TRIV3|nr:hypothetical protein TVAGG3_0701850 [Trichomonas vaginalis G3]EAX87119.1 retinitis pigmentosa GTPase regulator-like protein, putative [Trichomonas vaginalis G3]KAI5509292.1 hypothetical protein TVAGG3_0701850 [Trichomonas vaginalis G3]|eukprot:XP_001300049.1 retinitis pigmentosa GTPase regulator-like protein [Trichomonas vaginalis G3]
MNSASDSLKKVQEQISSKMLGGYNDVEQKNGDQDASNANNIPFSPEDSKNTFPTETSDVKDGGDPGVDQLLGEMMNDSGGFEDFEENSGHEGEDDFEPSESETGDLHSEIPENSNFEDSELSKASEQNETNREQTEQNQQNLPTQQENPAPEANQEEQKVEFKNELNTVLEKMIPDQVDQNSPPHETANENPNLPENIQDQNTEQQEDTPPNTEKDIPQQPSEPVDDKKEENTQEEPKQEQVSIKGALTQLIMGNDDRIVKDPENKEQNQNENTEQPPKQPEGEEEMARDTDMVPEEEELDVEEEEMNLDEEDGEIPEEKKAENQEQKNQEKEDHENEEMEKSDVEEMDHNSIISSNENSEGEEKEPENSPQQENEEPNKEKEEEKPKTSESQKRPVVEKIEGMTVRDSAIHSRLSNERQVTARDLPLLQTNPDIEGKCRQFLQQFRKHKKFPDKVDSDFRIQFSQFLNREKVNCVAQEKYQEAHELQEIAILFSNMTKNFMGNERIDEKIGQLEDRIVELDKQIQQIKVECDKNLKKSHKEHDEFSKTLKTHQSKDLEQFNMRWNDMDHLKQFTKPSPVLLNMTYKENATVSGKMFDRAEEFKRMVSQQEKEESAYAQERAMTAMRLDRKKMDEKHIRERKAAETQRLLSEQSITNDYLRELKTLNQRKDRLIREIDGLKTLKLKGILPPLKPKSSKRLRKRGEEEPMTITPRTVSRFTLCKTTVHQPHVSIKPLGNVGSKTSLSTTV